MSQKLLYYMLYYMLFLRIWTFLESQQVVRSITIAGAALAATMTLRGVDLPFHVQ